MNLLYFDIKTKRKIVYFSNVSIDLFLKAYWDFENVSINEIYAHSIQGEFDIEAVVIRNNLSGIENFRNNYENIFITTLKISIGEFETEINDEYEYFINFGKTDLLNSPFIDNIRQLLNISTYTWDLAKKLDSNYVLLKNDEIIKTFKTFDEFKESEFADLEG